MEFVVIFTLIAALAWQSWLLHKARVDATRISSEAILASKSSNAGELNKALIERKAADVEVEALKAALASSKPKVDNTPKSPAFLGPDGKPMSLQPLTPGASPDDWNA